MTKIKSYTDLEQSKKLAEILPIESADMYWYIAIKGNPKAMLNEGYNKYGDFELPCWSLATLFDALNKSAYFINEDGIAEISSSSSIKWSVSLLNCGKIEPCYADNPIDACVAMIEKLHEFNLL